MSIIKKTFFDIQQAGTEQSKGKQIPCYKGQKEDGSQEKNGVKENMTGGKRSTV